MDDAGAERHTAFELVDPMGEVLGHPRPYRFQILRSRSAHGEWRIGEIA
jgi:hypothetical protein